MLAVISPEQESGAAATFVGLGQVALAVAAAGIGFVLTHGLLCSRSTSGKVDAETPKLLQEEERDKPQGKWAKADATPTTDGASMASDKAIPTPTTDAGSDAGDKSPCTPIADMGSMADAKELARALARESRAAAVAEAAAVCAATVFIEALVPEQKSFNAQVRAIAREAFSDAAVQTHKGEKVAALVLGEEVVGYASYQLRSQLSSLNINKLAVSSSRRRQGLGRCLLRHLIQLAKRPVQKSGRSGGKGPPPLEVVCLSALPTAITFYKACGFKEEPGVKLPEEDGEELEEGQLYMEYRLRRRGRK